MKNRIRYLFVLVCMISCTASNRLTQDLTHTWKITQVISDGDDVTLQHNPNNDRYIRFDSNGSFESGGSPVGINTGKYVLDTNEHTLFLDSDAGEDDDSTWKINLQGNEMTWSGIGSAWHESFKLTFKKYQINLSK